MSTTRFSIATPTWNSLSKLKRCVGSIRGQKSESVAHLIQDAASTDGTPEWLMQQPDLFAVSEPDRGMYDAIGRAWQRAEGEIVSWLNADEQYLPGTLKRVSDFFRQHSEVDVVFGDTIVADGNGTPVAQRQEIPFRRFYVANSFLNAMSCTTFFRRKLLDSGQLGFDPELRYAADMDLMLRLQANGSRIIRIPAYLSIFGIDGSNLSTHEGMQLETASIQRKYGGFQSPALRQVALVGRRLERLVQGGYRRRPVSYDYAIDDTPVYTRMNAPSIGGRYSLDDA